MTTNASFPQSDYGGAKSTLCTGCGHDSVTQAVINAYFKSGVHPYRVAKLSGIGCSSKTPAYFLGHSHGFNTIHGRMAPVALGAKVANRDLHVLGVSGDGDSASIGLGGFVHLIRRNVPMVYIIENNGVYGLTKGQFSATSDVDSTQKSGDRNPFTALDLCALAVEAGCGFVARSFSGDAKQLVPLLQAAIEHNGTAVLDIISPCITYANHEGSTKSYDYVKSHKIALQELGYISEKQETVAEYDEADQTSIALANGQFIFLRKLDQDHRLNDAAGAIKTLHAHRERGEIVTGLIFHDSKKQTLEQTLSLPKKPLVAFTQEELTPSQEVLRAALASYR